MKNFQYKLIALGLLLCFISGCSLASRIKKEVDKSQTPQVLTDTDNMFQITAPGNWQKQTDLHDDAAIQAGSLINEQYLVIIREAKEDFGSKFTLDSLTEIVRDNFKKAATDTVLTQPIPVYINGYPARQFETSGEIDNLKIKYLYAIVETPHNYYQIITWTLSSKFDKNKSVFSEVINSFKETGYSDSFSPSSNLNSNTKNELSNLCAVF